MRQHASFANFGGGQCAVTTDSDGQAGQPPHLKPSLALTLPLLLFFTHARRRTRLDASQMYNQPPNIDPEIGAFSTEGSFSIIIYTLYTFITERSRFAGRPAFTLIQQVADTCLDRNRDPLRLVTVIVTVTRYEIQYVSNLNACACPVLPVAAAL